MDKIRYGRRFRHLGGRSGGLPELCVDVAASIAAQAELDRYYRALFGTWRGDA